MFIFLLWRKTLNSNFVCKSTDSNWSKQEGHNGLDSLTLEHCSPTFINIYIYIFFLGLIKGRPTICCESVFNVYFFPNDQDFTPKCTGYKVGLALSTIHLVWKLNQDLPKHVSARVFTRFWIDLLWYKDLVLRWPTFFESDIHLTRYIFCANLIEIGTTFWLLFID